MNMLSVLFRSVNEVICHGIPDNRPLENGDIVNSKIIYYLYWFWDVLTATETFFLYFKRQSVDRIFLTLTVDISVFHNGFHGDLNETFFIGEVDEESKKLVKVTHECLAEAIKLGMCRLT